MLARKPLSIDRSVADATIGKGCLGECGERVLPYIGKASGAMAIPAASQDTESMPRRGHARVLTTHIVA